MTKAKSAWRTFQATRPKPTTYQDILRLREIEKLAMDMLDFLDEHAPEFADWPAPMRLRNALMVEPEGSSGD